jgi:hypothetical protein
MTDADDIFLDELRAAATTTADPLPSRVKAAALAAYTWRTIDAELAQLSFDSADEAALAGVRGDAPRLLSFSSDDVTIDVEVARDPAHRSLTGEAVPAPTHVEMQRATGDVVDVPCDANGRFRLDGAAPGPARFRLAIGGRIVTTGWVSI